MFLHKLFKPDLRFIPSAIHTNPLKENEFFADLAIYHEGNCIEKTRGSNMKTCVNIKVSQMILRLNSSCKVNVPKVNNKCLHVLNKLSFFGMNDSYWLLWISINYILHFYDGIYLITKCIWHHIATSSFLQQKFVVSNSSRICAKNNL